MAICTPPGRASYICTYIYIYIPFVHIHTANTDAIHHLVAVVFASALLVANATEDSSAESHSIDIAYARPACTGVYITNVGTKITPQIQHRFWLDMDHLGAPPPPR